jgi:hypothetical protein
MNQEEEELTYGEICAAREEILDNIDRPERHNINIANRPPRSIDPLSPRNLEHMETNVGKSNYSKKTIQPWEIIDEYELDFYEGNVLKYLLRTKGSRKEDLEKIQHYIVKMLADLKE